VGAAMVASCNIPGDATSNVESGDIAHTSGGQSQSNVLTVPSRVSTVATSAPASSTDAQMAEALAAVSAHADELAETDRFSGAMLVAHNGEILFEDAWGFADREAGIPNTVDTKFRIASINKMFTAVATLQLVESGRLALDDPIGKYLTDYPNEELASTVTVRHLLTHTGGTGDVFDDDTWVHRLELRQHTDWIARFGEREVSFEPGSRYEYSNYGFILLGALIEAVTGGSYYDYVRGHVFAVAGMTATDSLPESESVPGRAVAYTKSADSWVSAADQLLWRGNAAGLGYSTIGDLMRFADALTSGRLVSDTMLAEATRAHPPAYQYGFGIELYRGRLTEVYGHGGSFPGVNGVLRIYPDLGYVVVVLSNFDPPAAQELVSFTLRQTPDL
jgi:CubicO group peptidase (beta-lactamase class C family)